MLLAKERVVATSSERMEVATVRSFRVVSEWKEVKIAVIISIYIDLHVVYSCTYRLQQQKNKRNTFDSTQLNVIPDAKAWEGRLGALS